jgi:hypothetical protein
MKRDQYFSLLPFGKRRTRVRGSKPTCQIAEQTLTVLFSLAKGEATHTCLRSYLLNIETDN